MAFWETDRTQTWYDTYYAYVIETGAVIANEQIFRTFTGPFRGVYKNSVNTPDYKLRILRGESLPAHEYSLTKKFNSTGFIDHTFREQSGPAMYISFSRRPAISFYGWDDPFIPPWDSLTLKALKKLKGESWQAGVALAEAKKTSSMITSGVTKMAKSISNLRKGDLVGALQALGGLPPPSTKKVSSFNKEFGKDAAKAAGNTWLEIKYGWLPLMHDVEGAAASLARSLFHDRKSEITIKTRIKLHDYDSSDYNFEISPQRAGVLTAERNCELGMVIKYRPASVAIAAAQSVDLVNLASVAWELVPFSFVADWFIPIGDTLAVLDADYGKTFVSGTKSLRLIGDYTLTAPAKNPVPSGQAHLLGGSISWSRYYKSRQTLPDFPDPPLPKFEPNLSLDKMVSGLALLQQQLSKLKK